MNRRAVRRFAAALSLLLLMLIAVISVATCWRRDALPCQADPTTSSEEQAVILYIDAHRRDYGLLWFNNNTDLARSAQWKADDMARGGYIAHDDPNLRSWDQRIRDCGFEGNAIGETLAFGQQTALEVERAWEQSPDHNAILLSPDYTQIGVGVADGANGRRYWAADFGSQP